MNVFQGFSENTVDLDLIVTIHKRSKLILAMFILGIIARRELDSIILLLELVLF